LVKPKIREPKDKWLKEAQAFEFDFHKNNAFRQSDEFILETKQLFRSFGFHPNDFINKTILDLGAGSRMRGKFFSGAFQIIIEPMAERCMKEIPWCDFKDAGQVFSLPAEETIPDLKGKVDFLFSINVLDHCHDFESIVANIYLYLKPGGKAFLSFDSHFEISLGHPLILTESICSKIFKQQGFKIDKITEGFHREYAKSSGKPGYDNSSNCLSYWLSKT
jgi:2-polyprenyl-3-methyl-5-hydroxy-6-metoxy-1,4-benzoquinol methylase